MEDDDWLLAAAERSKIALIIKDGKVMLTLDDLRTLVGDFGSFASAVEAGSGYR